MNTEQTHELIALTNQISWRRRDDFEQTSKSNPATPSTHVIALLNGTESTVRHLNCVLPACRTRKTRNTGLQAHMYDTMRASIADLAEIGS